MSKKKMMLAAALITGCTMVKAQMVNYTTPVNNPNSYKRSMLYLDLFTADTHLDPTMGSGAKFETMVGGRIMPWAQVKFAWADAATHHVVSGYPTNEGGQKKHLSIEAGGALFLTNQNLNKKVRVVLSSHRSGNYTHTRYLNVSALVKRQMGVRGGIFTNRMALEFDDDSHKYFHYESKDGKIVAPIQSVGSSGVNQPAGEYYKPVTNASNACLYGGLHKRKITNVSISTNTDGYKSNRAISDLYVDVMLSPVTGIANVVDIKGQEWKIVADKGGIRHLGWRAGYSHHNGQKVSLCYNFEVGQRPGPVMGESFMGDGSYISIGMGISIGSNKFFGIPPKSSKKSSPSTTKDKK
jgi:hypothetical protein